MDLNAWADQLLALFRDHWVSVLCVVAIIVALLGAIWEYHVTWGGFIKVCITCGLLTAAANYGPRLFGG